MCVGIHRSKASLSPRNGAAMPGCQNRLSFCPRARSWTPSPRKGLNVERGELDLLSIQSRITFQNLLGVCALAQHICNEFDWNARSTIHRSTSPNRRVGDNQILRALKSLQILVEFKPHGFNLNYQG